MQQVAASYANALLALAQSPAQADGFEQVLQALAALYTDSAELRDFLHNPVLPRAAQKQALLRLAPPGAPRAVLNCLQLMVDKGRIALLPEMAEAYRQRRAALAGTLLIRVCSPEQLDEAETEQIKRVFARRFGAADATVEACIDPQLIGGIRVQIGDILFDQSLQGRLTSLARAIKTDGK